MDDLNPTPEEQPLPEAQQHAPLPFANPVSSEEANSFGAAMHGEARLASFGRRILGYLLDGLIVGVPIMVIAAATKSSSKASVLVSFLSLGATILYAWLLIAKRNGQTLGMQALGIRCVREIDGESVDSRQSGQRAIYAGLFSLASLFIIIPGLIDLLWAVWDKKNQTLHDKLAKTVVIDIRSSTSTISF